jgi:hypothetical protein
MKFRGKEEFSRERNSLSYRWFTRVRVILELALARRVGFAKSGGPRMRRKPKTIERRSFAAECHANRLALRQMVEARAEDPGNAEGR